MLNTTTEFYYYHDTIMWKSEKVFCLKLFKKREPAIHWAELSRAPRDPRLRGHSRLHMSTQPQALELVPGPALHTRSLYQILRSFC